MVLTNVMALVWIILITILILVIETKLGGVQELEVNLEMKRAKVLEELVTSWSPSQTINVPVFISAFSVAPINTTVIIIPMFVCLRSVLNSIFRVESTRGLDVEIMRQNYAIVRPINVTFPCVSCAPSCG